ncbi:MAG: hypothetical protein Q8942_09195 [Bacillota bacterium]|nr:hypothetical protein [Bacillota bacterium]
MNELYKSSFNNINVSEDALNELISKAVHIEERKRRNKSKYSKFLIPVTAIFAASVITVTAASYLGVIDVFKDFYNQFFDYNTSEFNQNQINILKKYGVTNIGGISENGINLNIEGLIEDTNYLFLKYSVSYDHEPFIYHGAPELYIGDVSKPACPRSCVSSHQFDNSIPNKINYASIFDIESSGLLPAQNATIVMTSNEVYKPIKIDVFQTYNRYGIFAQVNSQGFFDSLSDRNINISLDNEYGEKLILNSIGFADNYLTLFVNSSRQYKKSTLFLRNIKTGKIYSSCAEFKFAVKEGLDYYSFKLQNISMLKDLEIVMPKEFHFTFPLSKVASAKNIDLSKHVSLTLDDIRIVKLNVSPLSLKLDGYYTSSGFPADNIHLAIKLKDNTELSDFKNSSFSSGNADKSFNIKVPFESPIMLDSIKSVVIKYSNKSIEIPIK